MVDIVVFSLIVLIFGVLPGMWYLRRKEKGVTIRRPNAIIVVLTVLLLSVNTYFAYFLGQGSIAYVLGYVYTIPLLPVLIFGRNGRSRWNTAFYASLVIFLSILANWMTAAGEMVQQGQT